jgi:protein-tyrosine phosphatase
MPPRRVDIHCHCLPGIDDGPATLPEAIGLCRLLVTDGATDVIATPHQLGRYDGFNAAPQVRDAVAQLQSALNEKDIPLTIHPGGEVRVDERIPRLLRDDGLLTLGDLGEFLLIELSTAAYIKPEGLLAHLSQTGLQIILAHPERYVALQRDHDAAHPWIACGAALQLNADSLLGGAGAAARDAAWDWLERGWVSLVASDAHNVAIRRPRMSEAIESITRRLGDETARRVCVENPLRVLRAPPPPEEGRGETK